MWVMTYARMLLTTCVVCWVVASGAPGFAIAAPVPEPVNPLVMDQDFPDPSVMAAGGVYYGYSTNAGGFNIPVAQSFNLGTWSVVGDALPTLGSWVRNSANLVWAPAVAHIGDQYVMYYTASNGQHQCIGRAVATVPSGPFRDTFGSPLVPCSSGASIDPQPLRINNDWYLYWKAEGSRAQLRASRLTGDGLQLTETTTTLLTQGGSGTIEGPQMVVANGQFRLFYSEGDWTTAGYHVSYAQCTGPLGACSAAGSVVVTTNWIAGPGGQTIFIDASGHWQMALHGWRPVVGYPRGGRRALYVSPVDVTSTPPAVTGHGPTPINAQALIPRNPLSVVYSDGELREDGGSRKRVFNPAFPFVGGVRAPGTNGGWLVGSDGGVFTFGGSKFYGSQGATHLNQPMVGMAATPTGKGYWLVAADGGVFTHGDARFYGSEGNRHLNKPVVGMATIPSGDGYWLVAADGGIFTHGKAHFYGSEGSRPLNAPVVGMAATPTGRGYWLVAADGGVFTHGDARFHGAATDIVNFARARATAIVSNGTGGYTILLEDGAAFGFGSGASLPPG